MPIGWFGLRFVGSTLAAVALSLGGTARACQNGPERLDAKDFTVYAFSQSGTSEEDPQIHQLKPDVNIRAWQKWSIWGDEVADYDFTPIGRYHQNGIAFIAGGSASVIFAQDFATAAIFDDLSTRDADGLPVPHDYIVPGARRGSLFNPAFRKYVVDYCKIQIDGGVDGLFLDEVIAGFGGGAVHFWNGNEGFDDCALADFNRYLLEKYPDFTAQDWKTAFAMTDDNLVRKDVPPEDLTSNFDYRRYLQAHGLRGVNPDYSDSPVYGPNPLASEWGFVTTNRMYAGDTSFTGTALRRYWQEMVDELREYAGQADRQVLITSNGVFPFVDFNSVGMYSYNPDEQTPDGRGADYVPVVDGHLNGAKSLMPNYRYLKELSAQVSGDVPLVVFIDWPTDMMTNYLNLPLSERMDYWRIFGAEAYASGIYPAFHLKDTVGSPTAADLGMLGFFQEYTRFYAAHRRLYRPDASSGLAAGVSVGATGIAANLLLHRGGRLGVLHLVNHNYDRQILSQQGFEAAVDLPWRPRRVTMVSPDFAGVRRVPFTYREGRLGMKIDGIRHYDVVVIE